MTTLSPVGTEALLEGLVRDPAPIDAALTERDGALALLPRLVLTGLGGYAAFGAVQAAIGLATGDLGGPIEAALFGGRVAAVYAGGIFVAKIAALPSAHFYALLGGVRTHGWRLAVESMRAQATGGVMLAGLLPVWGAAMLGLALISPHAASKLCVLGYGLPFFSGLFGAWGLFRTFRGMVVEAGVSRGRRAAVPSLFVFAWTALMAVLGPLGVWAFARPVFGF